MTISDINENSATTRENGFQVGLLRPEDAEGVVRLFRAVHGEAYPIKIFYDAAQITKANRDGDYYSVVARSSDGEIIGIHNLFRSAPSRDAYEWGVGLVLKEWRSKGVSNSIENLMINNVIPELGMHTVFGEPVTNHVQMQKSGVNRQFHVTALEIGLMPGEAYSGEGVTSSRVSTLLYFRIYRNIPQRIFLPETYTEALNFLYQDFSEGRTFSESTSEIPEGTVSVSKMDLFDFAKVARIAFHETGTDFAQQVINLETKAVKDGCLVIQVWLKLTEPWVGKVVTILQDMGFILGGLLPQWFDEDGLLMQKLHFQPDFDSMKLYSERSKRIADILKEDYIQMSAKSMS